MKNCPVVFLYDRLNKLPFWGSDLLNLIVNITWALTFNVIIYLLQFRCYNINRRDVQRIHNFIIYFVSITPSCLWSWTHIYKKKLSNVSVSLTTIGSFWCYQYFHWLSKKKNSCFFMNMSCDCLPGVTCLPCISAWSMAWPTTQNWQRSSSDRPSP